MKHIAIFGSSGSLGTAVSPVLQKLGYKIFKVDQHGNVDEKIQQAMELRDAGKKAHDEGDHAKSEELLIKALNLFKS